MSMEILTHGDLNVWKVVWEPVNWVDNHASGWLVSWVDQRTGGPLVNQVDWQVAAMELY